jgi:hypothetical protein
LTKTRLHGSQICPLTLNGLYNCENPKRNAL